ncbi:hypothetical protein CIT292_07666 [Citrobacter youngae ATCC 29220]|uniref:Uncharacterized protein n=1 Tax=Citrobacter youngae ATCC 29220 TaxID=500640 RepID=D4BB19_9ENTR|nr:hypothetical protein CIT292_07666 [Citrobacter youngae ATCC 29220]
MSFFNNNKRSGFEYFSFSFMDSLLKTTIKWRALIIIKKSHQKSRLTGY